MKVLCVQLSSRMEQQRRGFALKGSRAVGLCITAFNDVTEERSFVRMPRRLEVGRVGALRELEAGKSMAPQTVLVERAWRQLSWHCVEPRPYSWARLYPK